MDADKVKMEMNQEKNINGKLKLFDSFLHTAFS